MNIITSFENAYADNYTSSKDFCKMKPEYAVKISLTEHNHDNPTAPYYWSLVKYESSWYQIAFGWETSPKKCLTAALDCYHELTTTIFPD